MFTCVLGRYVASTVLSVPPKPFGGQLHGDKEWRPFSVVTSSGSVWRKVSESNARSKLYIGSVGALTSSIGGKWMHTREGTPAMWNTQEAKLSASPSAKLQALWHLTLPAVLARAPRLLPVTMMRENMTSARQPQEFTAEAVYCCSGNRL